MRNDIVLGPVNNRYFFLTGGIRSKATLAYTNIDIYVSQNPECKNPQTEGELYAKGVILYYDDAICEWKVLSVYDSIEKEVLEKIKQTIALQAIN